MDDLPDLVDRGAGGRAPGRALEICGLPPSLPASVELAAYRVVQESLTNALRYAQAPTRVRLTHTNGGLDVLVEDDGSDRTTSSGAANLPAAATVVPAVSEAADVDQDCALRGEAAALARTLELARIAPAALATPDARSRLAAGGGRGLAGLAERAQILGGSLHAGPLPGGGFAVHARLPVQQ